MVFDHRTTNISRIMLTRYHLKECRERRVIKFGYLRGLVSFGNFFKFLCLFVLQKVFVSSETVMSSD